MKVSFETIGNNVFYKVTDESGQVTDYNLVCHEKSPADAEKLAEILRVTHC